MFDTRTVEQALVRICGPNQATKGTGFFLNSRGLILTCDHVLGQLTEVLVQTPDGQHHSARCTAPYRFPEIDLAVIATDLTPTTALPVDFGYKEGMRVWTKGFQYQSSNLTAAFPLRATISGTTSIRYKTETQFYQLEKVLVLTDAEIDEGLSGAPLIDEETGVIIGVVNTTFRKGGGFALPFLSETEYPAPLQEIIAWNRVHIPRYGRFLNTAGAGSLCKSQVKAALGRLEKEGLFLPSLSFERPALREEINRFLQGDALILPIVGEAGTGKTTLLALLASSLLEKQPCLLLRASLMNPDGKSLQDAVEDTLRLSEKPFDFERLPKVLNTKKRRLLILLDGLNEVPPSVRENITVWTQQSISWLEEVSAQLIVTSRPGFWNLIKRYFPSQWLYEMEGFRSGPSPKDSFLPVENFTTDEAKTALRIYGLEQGSITARDVQHPLLARIYWELSLKAPATHFVVFREFVERKCERVALIADASPVFVQHLLSKAAKWMYQSGQYTLELDLFFDQALFGGERLIGEKLLAENVFAQTPAGLRFAFDELAEFLQGEHVNVEEVLDAIPSKKEDSLRLGAVAFAVLKLEHRQDWGALANALERLIDHYSVHGSYALRMHLIRIFSLFSQPETVISFIRRFAAKMVERGDDRADFLRFHLPGLRLSLKARFSVFQILARGEHAYSWEDARHWEEQIPECLKYEWEFATIISKDIKRDPIPCFRELTTWLKDDSPLCGGGMARKVQNVAQGLLFHFRHLAFDELCEMLAESGDKGTDYLFLIFGKKDPELLLSVCERWAKNPISQRQNLIADCSNGILQSPGIGAKEIQRLIALFRRLLEITTSSEVTCKALHALYLIKESRESVLPTVIEGFLTDKPYLTASLLACGLKTHFNAVIEAFKLVLMSQGDERKEEVLLTLLSYEGSDCQNEIILEIFENLPLENYYDVARYIENKFLYVGPQSTLFKRIIALAEKFIHQKGASIPLIYGTIGKDHPDTLEERAQLLDYMIECESDIRMLGMIAGELVTHIDITPNAFDRILAVGKKIPQEEFESWLIETAYHHPKFVVPLAEFLHQPSDFSPRFRVKEFLDLIENGYSPPEAARKCLNL